MPRIALNTQFQMEWSLTRLLNDYALKLNASLSLFHQESQAFLSQAQRQLENSALHRINHILEDLQLTEDSSLPYKPKVKMDIESSIQVQEEELSFPDLFADFAHAQPPPSALSQPPNPSTAHFGVEISNLPAGQSKWQGVESSGRKSLLQKLQEAVVDPEQQKKKREIYEQIIQNNTLEQIIAKKDQILKSLGCKAPDPPLSLDPPSPQDYFISDEDDSDQHQHYQYVWKEADTDKPKTPTKLNIFQTNFLKKPTQSFQLKLNNPKNLFQSPIKNKSKKRLFCNQKRVPDWAADLQHLSKTINKQVHDPNEVFGRFCVQNMRLQQIFGESFKAPRRTSSANWKHQPKTPNE